MDRLHLPARDECGPHATDAPAECFPDTLDQTLPKSHDAAGAVDFEHWARVGGVAVFAEPPPSADWLREMRHAIGRVPEAERPRIGRRATEWTVFLNGRSNPLLLPRLQPARRGEVHTIILPVPEERVSLAALWHWRRRGTHSIWFPARDGWMAVDAQGGFTRRLFRHSWRALGRAFLPERFHPVDRAEANVVGWAMVRRAHHDAVAETLLTPDGSPDIAPWACWVGRDNAVAVCTMPEDRPLRVLQYSGALYCGGAERQLCNLTIGLAGGGADVRARTTYPPVGERGHYVHLLQPHAISVRAAGTGFRRVCPPARFSSEMFKRVPVELRSAVLALGAEIADHRPDILHCWLDEPNVIGGIAGLLFGVPRVLLAVRNVNPTHFPRLHTPYMNRWYRLLATSERVHFLSNSRAGAQSYAKWLGISAERFHVVPNGLSFDHFPRRSPAAVRSARAAFGLSERDRVVGGVFRLDEEKRPTVFLAVVREAARRVPFLKVLLAGSGPLESEIRHIVREHGMSSYVQLLGRRADVGTLLLASDVLLLTSAYEGCPNVVMEAQGLGVPVVATRGGGTPEALVEGRTGLLSPADDIADLERNVRRLLLDDTMRAQFSQDAQTFAPQHFDLNQMVDRTRLAYHRLFDAAT